MVTNQLNLGSIQIPLNAATKTFAILAKRGAGKTWTAAVMAEEFFKAGIPFVVIDPIDMWWGLRLAANGKDPGLPVVVFGIEHADILLDRDMGRKIAQSIVKENISCVINTFGLPKVAQRHLIAEFAEELLNLNNTPRHVFIEEAHEFVPQRVFGGLGKIFNAVSNLVVMGRNRGIGVTLINQRAATINKDVLTQLDTLLAFQNVSPQDRGALRDWVEFHAAEGDFEKFMVSLPSLPKGEGWLWSPEFLGIFERIKIRKRETFHPDREQLGDKFVMPHLSQVDIQSFIGRFAQSMEEGKKKKGLSEKPAAATEPQEPLKPKESAELIALRNQYESKLMQKDLEIRRLNETIEQVRRIVGASNGSPVLSAPATFSGNNVQMWLDKLKNGGAARIFKFLAENSSRKFTKSQIGLAVALKSSTGSFNTYMSKLRSNHLIVKEGDCFRINPDL